MNKDEIINWLESRVEQVRRIPEPLISQILSELAGEAKAIAAAWDKVACGTCGGFGQRT